MVGNGEGWQLSTCNLWWETWEGQQLVVGNDGQFVVGNLQRGGKLGNLGWEMMGNSWWDPPTHQVGNLQRGGKLVVGNFKEVGNLWWEMGKVGNLQGKWWATCGGQLAKRWATYSGKLGKVDNLWWEMMGNSWWVTCKEVGNGATWGGKCQRKRMVLNGVCSWHQMAIQRTNCQMK